MTLPSAWKLVALWGALIVTLTSLPGSTVPDAAPFAHFDKLVHGCLYGVLSFLVARALPGERRESATQVLPLALLSIAAFAALDEWHQRFIPGRTAAWPDWSADMVGALFGVLVYQLARSRREINER